MTHSLSIPTIFMFYLFRNVLFCKLLFETCVQVRKIFFSANLFSKHTKYKGFPPFGWFLNFHGRRVQIVKYCYLVSGFSNPVRRICDNTIQPGSISPRGSAGELKVPVKKTYDIEKSNLPGVPCNNPEIREIHRK